MLYASPLAELFKTISTSLGSIQSCCYYCTKNKWSHIHQSIARYSFIQLSDLRQVSERNCQSFETAARGFEPRSFLEFDILTTESLNNKSMEQFFSGELPYLGLHGFIVYLQVIHQRLAGLFPHQMNIGVPHNVTAYHTMSQHISSHSISHNVAAYHAI